MITLDEVRKATGLPASEDKKNSAILQSVIAQWESLTKKKFSRRQGQILTLIPASDEYLYIQGPNVSVTQIRHWNHPSTPYVLDELEYRVFHMDSLFSRIATRNRWLEEVEITYDIGWSEIPPEFADIRQAFMSQIAYTLQRYSGEKVIMNSQGFEGGSTNFIVSDMSLDFKAAVKRYERKV